MRKKILISEESLLLLLGSGSEEGFRILYENYSGALYHIIFKVVEDEAWAEDLLQDSFVRIWKNFHQYSPEKGRLFTWMLNLTRNLAVDAVRSRRFRDGQKNQSLDQSNAEDPAYGILLPPEDPELDKAIARLNDEQIKLIELSYFQGFTHEEISLRLGMPLGTVKSKIRKSIQCLRKYLT